MAFDPFFDPVFFSKAMCLSVVSEPVIRDIHRIFTQRQASKGLFRIDVRGAQGPRLQPREQTLIEPPLGHQQPWRQSTFGRVMQAVVTVRLFAQETPADGGTEPSYSICPTLHRTLHCGPSAPPSNEDAASYQDTSEQTLLESCAGPCLERDRAWIYPVNTSVITSHGCIQ